MPFKLKIYTKIWESWRTLLICLLLIAATGAVYGQVREFDFINFDDDDYVYANPHIQEGLTREAVAWAFTTAHAGNWHPLTWISHMIDIQLFGRDPGGHHLVNLLFHIANTLILFLVFYKMTGSRGRSAVVAALFAFHPLHVESVAWISERKDVLSAFFWLLAMGMYVRYAQRPSVFRYTGVFLLFVCGLLSKPMVVTLPFVFLLMDYWPLDRIRFRYAVNQFSAFERFGPGKIISEKIPLLVFAAASSIATLWAQKQGGAVVGLEMIPLGNRIANSLVAYGAYLQKMICPVDLAVIYPHPRRFEWYEVAGAAILLLAVTGVAFRAARKQPWFAMGWLWFLGTLVPVIGIVQVGSQAMADRYTYLPAVGLFLILAWGTPELIKEWRCSRILNTAAAALILLALSALTFRQAGFWKNSRELFAHTLAVTSDNYTAHNNLAAALYRDGNPEEALSHYRRAVEINPDYAKGHFNLGVLLEQKGEHEAAIRHYKAAIRVYPGFDKAHFNLAVLLEQEGLKEAAARHYLTVIHLNPQYYQAYNNVGAILMKEGRAKEAMDYFHKALAIHPGYARAHFSLGLAVSQMGQVDEAVRHYRSALELDPEFEQARNNLCVTLFQGGYVKAAMDCFKDALQRNPRNVTARENYEKAVGVIKGGGGE